MFFNINLKATLILMGIAFLGKYTYIYISYSYTHHCFVVTPGMNGKRHGNAFSEMSFFFRSVWHFIKCVFTPGLCPAHLQCPQSLGNTMSWSLTKCLYQNCKLARIQSKLKMVRIDCLNGPFLMSASMKTTN